MKFNLSNWNETNLNLKKFKQTYQNGIRWNLEISFPFLSQNDLSFRERKWHAKSKNEIKLNLKNWNEKNEIIWNVKKLNEMKSWDFISWKEWNDKSRNEMKWNLMEKKKAK